MAWSVTTENELVTLLVRMRHHPHLAVVVDHVRTPVVGNTAHSRTLERARRDLEHRNRTQGPVSAKVAGGPPAVRMRLCDRCRSRRYSGPQHIRSGHQRFQREGEGRPLTPGESGFQSHRRIDHRVWLGPKGYTEGNLVLGGGSMVDYTQA